MAVTEVDMIEVVGEGVKRQLSLLHKVRRAISQPLSTLHTNTLISFAANHKCWFYHVKRILRLA